MKIFVATSNPHKLDEIQAIWAREYGVTRGKVGHRSAIELIGRDEIEVSIPEPIEDQITFEGNAALKARHYAKASSLLCLADDSGLEVDALDGAPGVHSARYAGVTGPRSVVDPANNRLLLEHLDGIPTHQRTARFVCAMALASPPHAPLAKEVKGAPSSNKDRSQADHSESQLLALVRGTVEGRILTVDEVTDPAAPECGRGTNGFGYDPLFLLPESGKTTAELAVEQKNAISHRARALRLMCREIPQSPAD